MIDEIGDNNRDINLEDYIVCAKMRQGYILKYIVDLFNVNKLTELSLHFSEEGITISEEDPNGAKMFEIMLKSEDFLYFKCNYPINIKVTLNVLYIHLKNIKKKDSLCLFIDTENNKLGINVIAITHNTIVKDSISLIPYYLSSEQAEFINDISYYRPYVIQGSDFQKNCKTMSQISKKVTICMQRSNFLSFFVGGGDTSTNYNKYGRLEPGIDIYKNVFDTYHLAKIVKLCGMTKQIKISYSHNKNWPLKLSSTLCELGFINIYIKNSEVIENEKNEVCMMGKY